MANYHRSAVANLPSHKWTEIETRREKPGQIIMAPSRSPRAALEKRKRQLKRKFFLFITLKIHPEHIKFLLWNSSFRVPLIPPIIIFPSLSQYFYFEGEMCFLAQIRHKSFTSSRVLWRFQFSLALLLLLFCHFYS